MPISLEPIRVRCLFEMRRVDELKPFWDGCSQATKADELSGLYAESAGAGWWKDRPSAPVFQLLEQAAGTQKIGIQAARLSLKLADRLGDLPKASQAMMNLRSQGAATLQDHLQWWRLMASQGFQSEAVWWLLENQANPLLTSETIDMLLLAQDFNQPRLGVELAEKYWRENAFQDRFWIVAARQSL